MLAGTHTTLGEATVKRCLMSAAMLPALLFNGLFSIDARAQSTPATRTVDELRFSEDFENGLQSWKSMAEAEFTVDKENPRAGAQCAHIRVPEGAALHYQHLERSFSPVQWGDEFHVTIWVRTQGVADGTGAYAALEFLDAAGQRVSIAHSRTDRGSGAQGWEALHIEGQATKRTERASIHLLLHAHGDAWFDDVQVVQTGRRVPFPEVADAERVITVDPGHPVLPRFGGVGFHVFDHAFPATQDYLDLVLAKRWRELNPSFARMNHQNSWDRAKLDETAQYMLRFKQETNTELYVTTWDPTDAATPEDRLAYARRVADTLGYWVKEKGATNITTYCMTNELSLGAWGSLYKDLPKFKEYHTALFQVFRERGLDVRLLATDASPFSYWDSLDWAAANMDDVTGVYGGHHYIAEYEPDDPYFYPWFLAKVQRGVDLARGKGKDFILGEFGAQQDGRTIDGIKRDVCIYWDTPMEPMVSIQLAEAVIAAVNAGVYGMGYWTFADFPDDYNPHYINKWGLFKRSGNDSSTRAHYYAYGLLTKFFRGPATSLNVKTNDPRLRVAAVLHHTGKTLSIAIVNRHEREIPVRIALGELAPGKPFRNYVYDPAHIPQHPFGDLQEASGLLEARDGVLSIQLGANTLAVLTTAYDTDPPAPVAGLEVTLAETGATLAWQDNSEPDFCYYRVYRCPGGQSSTVVENQIGSTIAHHFVDAAVKTGSSPQYAVLAVDRSGNVSAPAVK